MVIDVHCHHGLSARRTDRGIARFSFEPDGAEGAPGYDSYFSPRLLRRPAWFFVRRWLGVPQSLGRGDELDARIERIHEQQWNDATGADRLVLLAFDEYRDSEGRVVGPVDRGRRYGSDLYASNSFVRAACTARPDRYLLGASIHPYRTRDAGRMRAMLEEVAAGGAALIKWLPIHQNIDARDRRTIAFLRAAAEIRMPILVHYGGEMSLSRQHMEFELPGPMLQTLRELRADGAMPTVIVAHAATPSFIWQRADGFRALTDALLGEFADAPLYADVSALAAFGRTTWLKRLARRRELHRKLLWGSDYAIPVMLRSFRRWLDRETYRRIAAETSWIQRDLLLKRALGFDECVFSQAAEILRISA